MFENSSKIIQNLQTFKPVIRNLADSCVFQYNKISYEWLFETPHPYPNNFECSRIVECPQSKYIHFRFNQLKIDTKDGLSGKALTRLRDFLKITGYNGYEGQGHSEKIQKLYRSLVPLVWCRHASLNRKTPDKELFSGQFYPEQSVFYGSIGDPEGSSDVNTTRSKWMIANSSFLNITFQSDDVFNNFGTSLTFKCSNWSHLNATEKGKKSIKLFGFHGIISDLGFDAEMFKQKTDENTVVLTPKKFKQNSLIENDTMVSNGTGECNFIKLEENLIVAFIDAEIFEIAIKLENRIEKQNIFLYFGNTKTIEGRAHLTSRFREIIS